MQLWRRLSYLLPGFRRAEERDMQEELQSLAAMAQPGELGNLTCAAEQRRAVWGWTWLERLAQDLRYALRTMRQSPGFTATAVLSLALGIGANTAIFSMIDALLLRWLPVRNPEELVLVTAHPARERRPLESFSYAITNALADQKHIFAGVAGFSGASFAVGSAGWVTSAPGAWVTGGYYETLGLVPAAGRLLAPNDDQPGAALVCVISYGYWDRQLARDPSAIGRSVPIGGVPVTIVGVSPPGFVGANVGSIADITLPLAALPRVTPEMAILLGPGNFWLRVLARPKPGVTIGQANARLAAVWPQILERALPANWPPRQRKAFLAATFEFAPGGTGWTRLREMFRKPLMVLMGVVVLVLLIACANVANLLLARATARQREIAVRLAIGAGRGRIIRQLLTESTLLSLAGGIVGISLAWLSGSFLISILASGPSQVTFDLRPNWHILGFTSLVAIATGVLFGLAPAWQTTAAGPAPVLQEGSRASGSRSWLLSSLVSGQVALSLLLLIGAGLFIRTLQNLQNLDPGFRREGVLLIDLQRRRVAMPNDLLDALRKVPGVTAATVATHTPLSGATWSEPAVPKGQPLPENDNANFIGAGPHLFAILGTPLLAGREFTEADTPGTPAVAIINEAFARRHFPGVNPIGQHLSASIDRQPTDLEIVGVVRNANLNGLRAAPPPAVYVAYAQLSGSFPVSLVVRAAGSLAQTAATIRKEMQPTLGNEPLEIHPLSAQVAATLVQERMMATLGSGFGALALILASIGLYGLLSYSVARRTKEIGIRMALGAQRSRVVGMMVRSAVRLVEFGILLGLPAAWAASHWVRSMLFGLSPTDPGTIAGAVLLLLLCGLAAVFLPAWRASTVDPTAALRHD